MTNVVILEVPDGVYEENMFIVLLFVSLFNLLKPQSYEFAVLHVADDIYGRI